ncbi:glycosyl transferase family 1 [Paenibacillus sp. J53TS2]|uniref:glycosyltransferase family 4 protein n=1 Tax=Paenibacillus sp. J53TS2 TaxID=2807197 RepID=UPI001B090211|nr:glycosyltransferase family 4 protein [Paenibacillus sp. J53TS2]GIP49235.1 glycosyl transferase family 1 [Paenibacillus sp. J53TS2]
MTRKAAYVATVYAHLAAFHLPFMSDLRDAGFTVHAYAAPDHGRADVDHAGFECRDLPFSRNPLAPGNLRALRELIGWLKRERYDLIHVHTPNASVVCRLAARLAGQPFSKVVYTAHGFHYYAGAPWRNRLLYYPLERFLSRWTDVLVTINREDERQASAFPVRGRSVYVPGVGVDLPLHSALEDGERERLRRELGLAPDDFAVLCVAELNRNKNQGQLIGAIAELRRRGLPAVLLLAGIGGEEARCRQLAAESGAAQAVRFLGYRRDVPQLLQAADAVALLSRREGLPKALLEGLAAGKPLVATEVRGSRDLVVPGRNGYLVPVGDVSAAAAALERLQQDAGLRGRMGEYSRKLAGLYDLERICRDLTAVYAGLGLMERAEARRVRPRLGEAEEGEAYDQALSE